MGRMELVMTVAEMPENKKPLSNFARAKPKEAVLSAILPVTGWNFQSKITDKKKPLSSFVAKATSPIGGVLSIRLAVKGGICQLNNSLKELA